MGTAPISIALFLLSIGIQLAAAIYALLLIRLTGRKLAWISISVALALMTSRRIVAFTLILTYGKQINFDTSELIALVTSFLMLLGVLRIRNYFRSIHLADTLCKETAEDLRHALKRVEDEKGRSEAIIEAIGDGLTIQDKDYNILYQNKMHVNLFGNHVGEHCFMVYGDTVHTCEECPVAMSFRDGKIHTITRSLLTDKGMKYFENTASVLKDSEGQSIAGIEVVRDITDRKLMEESLQESENKFRNLAEKSLVGIYLIQDDKFSYVNPKLAEIFGYAVEELLDKKGPEDLVLPKDWPTVNENLRKRVSGEIESNHYSFSGLKKNKEIINLEAYGSKTVYKARPAVIGTLLDITERRRAEEELRREEEKYRDLFDSTLDGVYQVDADGVFILMNPAGARIFGYENPEEIIGKKALEYWRDPKDRDVFMAELKIKKTVSTYHMKAKKKTGEPLELESSSGIIEDEEGNFPGVKGILRDVTEREHLGTQLRHAQKMEAVGTLAGGIAHDFNNILNVIMGYGTMVLDSLETDSPIKGRMNEVLAAAEKAADLTKRLLAFSRKQVIDVKPVNINELILGLQKMLVRIIRESIEFKLDLADRPLMVLADAGQIEQVLMNLTANARDAMLESGRLTIGTELQELDNEYVAMNGYGEPGKYVLITVSDTGHGMDNETQKNIFEPFFTTKGIGEGTGLGLAISYGIIKQHSGHIKVQSEQGQGTVFRIYLPLSEGPAASDSETEISEAVKGGNETILVAEDDASLRKLTRIVLESYGYSVIAAEDGEDAILKFRENRDKIQLAILDMIMPKKNGKEVSEKIREANPRTKILFVSGYTMDTIKTKELTEFGFDFILKPIRPQNLLRKVREVLDK